MLSPESREKRRKERAALPEQCPRSRWKHSETPGTDDPHSHSYHHKYHIILLCASGINTFEPQLLLRSMVEVYSVFLLAETVACAFQPSQSSFSSFLPLVLYLSLHFHVVPFVSVALVFYSSLHFSLPLSIPIFFPISISIPLSIPLSLQPPIFPITFTPLQMLNNFLMLLMLLMLVLMLMLIHFNSFCEPPLIHIPIAPPIHSPPLLQIRHKLPHIRIPSRRPPLPIPMHPPLSKLSRVHTPTRPAVSPYIISILP